MQDDRRFRRARLCLLCECPVVDGGVQLNKHRLDKAVRWWKAHFETDLEDKTGVACHFCVWDLRFAEEHSEEKEPPDQLWWPKYEKQNNLLHKCFKYYTDGWMKPCSVKMTPLANEDKLLKEYRQRGFGQRHRCLFCPKNYAVNQNLVTHAKTVHPDQFFYCSKNNCGKLFHTEEEKTEHVEKEHQAKKGESLKCVYCGKVSTNRANHSFHLYYHHKGQIIRCKYQPCKKMFKTKEERDKHVDNFHSSGKYFCCFCNRYFEDNSKQWEHVKRFHKEALKCNATRNCPNYFKTEEDRQKHIQEMHSKKFKCIFCNVTFPQSGTLSTHIRSFHKDVALRCEYSNQCITWFKTEEERQKHYKEDHESGDNKTMCPFCKKMIAKNRIQLHFHIYHKKEKIIKCDYISKCPNYFSCEEDKLKHIQVFHDIYDEKLRCIYCEKIIPKNMRFHIKQWHKDVAIKCQEKCSAHFKTLEDREKHMREVHLAEKIWESVQCLYCDKILAGKNALGTHIQRKHSEIAIKCHFPRCRALFKSQEDLEEHFSLKPKHKPLLKNKSFSCDLCQKSFHFNGELKDHIISSHRRIMKKCPHCKKNLFYSKLKHIISNFCKVCNQKFQCLGLLSNHRKKCRPVFQCPVCAESFKKNSRLNYHCKNKHTVSVLDWKGLQFKSKGFKCDECLICFSRKTGLQRHIGLMHESTVCTTCNFCKKQFSSKGCVKRHISRNHLRPKEFSHCPVCNLRLATEKMKNHVQNNCNKALEQCKICDKIITARTMRNHMQRMH